MIKLAGSVTTVEKMDVEVSPEELLIQTKRNFTTLQIVQAAYEQWLATRGLGTDVKLRKYGDGSYFFEEYENNGSHYSGYYEVRGAYKEGDEVIFEQFRALINNLK